MRRVGESSPVELSLEGPRGAVISGQRAEGDPYICAHIEGGPHPTHG